jgi:hypothetical protein
MDVEALAEATDEQQQRMRALAREKFPSRFKRWLWSTELKLLPRMLDEGQQIVTVAEGGMGELGLLAVSDRRLIFLHAVRAVKVFEVPFTDIIGVAAWPHGKSGVVVIRRRYDEIRFVPISPYERALEIAAYVQDRISSLLPRKQDCPYIP